MINYSVYVVALITLMVQGHNNILDMTQTALQNVFLNRCSLQNVHVVMF